MTVEGLSHLPGYEERQVTILEEDEKAVRRWIAGDLARHFPHWCAVLEGMLARGALPTNISGVEQWALLDATARLRSIEGAVREQHRIFDEEKAELQADLRKALAAETAELEAKQAKHAKVRLLYRKRREQLADISKRLHTIEASEATAATQIEETNALRQQLEEALAALRAFPTAKVEAWAKKRQAMDPEALPRTDGDAVAGPIPWWRCVETDRIPDASSDDWRPPRFTGIAG